LISTVLVLSTLFTVSLADGTEDGKVITTESGISMTLTPECSGILWPGIAEDDPFLAEIGQDKDLAIKMYEQGGTELQCSRSIEGNENAWIFIIVFERDTPSDLNGSFADLIRAMSPDSFQKTDLFGYGMEEKAGIPFYKIKYQVSGDTALRLNQYSILTGSGKMHQINLMLMCVPGSNKTSFTDEEISLLDETSESIIGSIKLSDELASDVISPEGTEAFEIVNDGLSDGSQADSADPSENNSNTNTSPTSFFKAFTTFNLPVYIVLIVLALLLLLGSKLSKLHEWQEDPLSYDHAKKIQGFAAVAIIVHHLSQELAEQADAIGIFENMGVLFVGIFFFFSGYGLYTRLTTKKDYLKGFLKRRLVQVLIPFYICILVFTLAAFICGKKCSPLELLAVLSGWSLINANMWYIIEIAILYLAFFLIYRLIKNRTAATAVMALFVIAMMTGSFLLAHGEDMSCSYWFQGEWWYNSSFLFVIGILFAKHAGVLLKIARKGYAVLLPVFAVLTVLFGLQTVYMIKTYSYWSEIPGKDPAYLDKIRCLSFELPWIIFFVCFVLLVMLKVRFGNPVLKFLGSISLELYLIHNLFITGLHNGTVFTVKSNGIYIVLTILMSIGLATVISGVDKYLIELITGKKRDASLPVLKPGSHIHSIDMMRIVMAFFVVAIHMPFDGMAGEVFITYGKTAVPFFLVICGYFLYREDNKEMMKRLLKQTKRILIFFILTCSATSGKY